MSVLRTVQLRPARAADVDFLSRLHKAAMQDSIAQTWGWDEAWQQQHVHQHFDPSGCQIMVAEGHDVGVLSVVRQAEVVYLRNIAGLPTSQGCGLGTYLITVLLDEAHSGGKCLALQVLKVNRARNLSARLGFTMTGETATHAVMHAWPKSTASSGGRG